MTTYDDAYLKETLKKVFEDSLNYRVPKGVMRYDYAHTHGWWVRVTRENAHFRKFFSDGVYQSIEDALRNAIIYRHQILASFPENEKIVHPKTLPLEPEKRISLRSEAGKNNPYTFWVAKWYDKSYKIKRQCFSIQKFGHDEARALALEAAKLYHNKIPKLCKKYDVYSNDSFRHIPKSDVEILSSVNGAVYSSSFGGKQTQLIENSLPYGHEGAKAFILHLSIERDRSLRNKKLSAFLLLHNKLFCELCKFNFINNYPFLINDIIEVHHIVPLAKLSESTLITTDDLMLLCANCHLALHQGDAETNLRAAKELFHSKDGNEAPNP